MPFRYVYLITSNKSHTINFITSLCLQFWKRKTTDLDPDAPVLPPWIGSECWSNKNLLIEECLPEAMIHLHSRLGSWTDNPTPPPLCITKAAKQGSSGNHARARQQLFTYWSLQYTRRWWYHIPSEMFWGRASDRRMRSNLPTHFQTP